MLLQSNLEILSQKVMSMLEQNLLLKEQFLAATNEIEELKRELEKKSAEVTSLRDANDQKDLEIEEIIRKIESSIL